MFQAIEKNAKMTNGYASVSDVSKLPTPKRDEMPSWFLAET
jgi:mannosyl-oligosaccharide alpha-1,2-mannosidase